MLELLVTHAIVQSVTGESSWALPHSIVGLVGLVVATCVAFGSAGYRWSEWRDPLGRTDRHPYADSVLTWASVAMCCPFVASIAFLVDRRHAPPNTSHSTTRST